MKRVLQVLASGLLVSSLTACGLKTDKPMLQYMPHMHTTPVLKAQRGYDQSGDGASVMLPPEGTIPRGFTPYRITSAEQADRRLDNPLPLTAETLARGRERYNIYCIVCHGERGHGDGSVVPPYPLPKSLQSEQMREWGDGRLFHVITRGQGVMPAYASQIPERDRWAIIHYVRVLQRAENPSKADLKAYEERKQSYGR